MTRITGRKARELLDGTTPGPWQAYAQMRHPESPTYIVGPDGQRVAGDSMGDGVTHRNSPLVTAAPDLAETVAWLYGRESDDEAVWDDKYEVSVMVDGTVAVFDHEATTTFFTRDEAVGFARALLAAAEEARRG